MPPRGLTATRTVFLLSTVAACFAVLWARLFYPSLLNFSDGDGDAANGCCEVMFEKDINAIKIITEMCGTILNRQEDFNPKLFQAFQQGKITKDVINACGTEVKNKCNIEIAQFLSKKDNIDHSYKSMLDEIRSFNVSICLRHHFGVNPALLGAPRRMRVWGPTTSRHLRQERPMHFRPPMIHPALREKGRAIPQSHAALRSDEEKRINGRVPGKRPPMGGAGYVVPSQKSGIFLGYLLPVYTIAITCFFVYTLLKLISKKVGGNEEYSNFHSDPEFRRAVFSEDCSNGCARRMGDEGFRKGGKQESALARRTMSGDSTRLGQKERDTIMSAITGLLAEVDQQLYREGDTQTQYSTELKEKKNLEEVRTEEIKPLRIKELESSKQVDISRKESQWAGNGQAGGHQDFLEDLEIEETKPKVKVMGLELIAECEGGQKWSRPATPNLGVGGSSRPTTPIPPPYSPEPQNIFLEGSLPQQSQLLVTDSKTQALTCPSEEEPESPVILSSKMTLSLISLDAALPEEHIRQDEPPLHVEAKSDEDNLGTADSTLFDVDSVIDETGNNYESSAIQEQEGSELVNLNKEINEISEDEPTTNYTTATMSERAEAMIAPDLEDTVADVSNLDVLDLIEDQEDVQNEDIYLWNGNTREVEELRGQESSENMDSID